ncbi:stealth family protein [Canibacter zhoujuaniae]|uniref:stealth family protein n=1 Tax=Canibacter zhoujuaniae TaxID=2708343 RepID=UPI00141F2E2F|nr:stealth family protein [Canibacter zhoujuaniae]
MSIKSRLRMWAARNLSEQQKRQIREITSLAFLSDRAKVVTEFGKKHPVHSFDAFKNIAADLEFLRGTLKKHDIEWAELPADKLLRTNLVIADRDLEKFVTAVRPLAETGAWSIRAVLKQGFQVSITNQRLKLAEVQSIICRSHHFAPSGRQLSTAAEQIIVEPWRIASDGEFRADGNTHLPGTLIRKIPLRNTLLEYLTPAAWQRAQEHPEHRVLHEFPHMYEITQPIDVVYTWVDGNDPAWAARKQEALGGVASENFNSTALNQSRFQSRDELRYSLRSLEYYASWVNHIYIVTDQQIPSWLNTEHPKITVVDHKDIFSDRSKLPVFNSHAIESQLHHIAGLSEQYLYMNDDIVFMRPVEPSLFFTANGLSKYFPSNASLDIDEPSARDMPVLSAAKRNRRLLEEKYGRTVTNKFKHTPHPQLKSVLEQFEAENPELFAAVSASKFRHPEDYSIPSALYHYIAYAQGRAINSAAIKYGYLDIASADAEEKLASLSKHQKLDVLCLNDTATEPEQIAHVNAIMHDFLAERFPLKSSFEV